MPGSVAEGKEMVKEFCIRNEVHKVLDVGPGEATYYYALQDAGITQLDSVEIFPPYINKYTLRDKYHEVYTGDIYDFDWEAAGRYDLVILGDVVEHMVEERGRKVIADAVNNSRFVVVSLPIYGYPQGPSDGNVHEAHVEQYTDDSIREVLKDYTILESLKGEVVGVYIFTVG